MEIEWSNGVVEVIKIVLGCFFAMRLLSKQIKSVRTIGCLLYTSDAADDV